MERTSNTLRFSDPALSSTSNALPPPWEMSTVLSGEDKPKGIETLTPNSAEQEISPLPHWKQVLKPKSTNTLISEPLWPTHSLESEQAAPDPGRSLKKKELFSGETNSPRITVCKYRHFEVATKKAKSSCPITSLRSKPVHKDYL